MDKMICKGCGKVFYQYPSRTKQGVVCCSNKCRGKMMTGTLNVGFKRGYQVNSWGYKMIYHDGKKVYEHRVIMEEYLGRKLTKDEEVHHINGDKMDNRIDNLQLMTKEEHKKMHRDKNTGRFVTRIKEVNR